MMIKIPRQKVNLSWKQVGIVLKALLKGRLIRGKAISRFESRFAEYLNAKQAISVSSGRFALYLILKSLGLKKGDEVILPAYTYHVIPAVIIALGLKPVFVDIEADTFNINPRLIEEKITKKTKAVIPTHLFGYPCDMDAVMKIARKHKLFVIEDCAQACGAEYKGKKAGSIGDASYFSFEISKNMNTFGGSMIVTDNSALSDRIRRELQDSPQPKTGKVLKKILSSVQIWISTSKYAFSFVTYPLIRILDFFDKDILSHRHNFEVNLIRKHELINYYNFQFANVQALVGIDQLKKIDRYNERNDQISSIYSSILSEEETAGRQKKIIKPSPLFYTIKSKNRDKISKRMLTEGLDTRKKYMDVCPDLQVYKNSAYSREDWTTSRITANHILHLPLDRSLAKNKKILTSIRSMI